MMDFMFSPPGLILIAVVIIVGVFVWFFVIKKKKEEFTLSQFNDVVSVGMKDKMNFEGVSINAYILRDGLQPIGTPITKYVHDNGIQPAMQWDAKREEWVYPANAPKIPYDRWFFQFGHRIKLLRKLGLGKQFAIVDNKCLEKTEWAGDKGVIFNLKKDVNFLKWGGVFVTSKDGEGFVTDLAMNHAFAQAITTFQNFTAMLSYLETRQAKTIEKVKKKQEIKSKAYQASETVGDEDDESD